MTRIIITATLVACAWMTAGCDQVRQPELDAGEADQRGATKLDKPMAPGASFTDLPPLESPVAQQASPERQPEPEL
jgi:hypothetical protein